MTSKLLVLTALLEGATGVALMAAPSLPVSLLLGASPDTPGGLVVARVAGAAVLSIGLACWLARGDARSGAGRALIAGLLLYNVAVVAVLAHARLALDLSGVALWPAVALHAALAAWCLSARSGSPDRPPRASTP